MGMVAPEQRIASAFFVIHGSYGEVTRYAQERGVCRQWIYREAAALRNALATARQENEGLREQLRQARERQAELEARLAQAVVIDAQKQAEVACVGQARGVSLRDCCELLQVLLPGQTLSVAQLGRRTQAAGKKAGELLAVLDKAAQAESTRSGSGRNLCQRSRVDGRRTGESVLAERSVVGRGQRRSVSARVQAVAEPRTGDA